ncbi:YdcF family protein [Pseudochryseolinea flava]|uniref:YdcF family protein n=1 Tax=Pseudochryseolinea flava TaxID=2059302 RepID=A0A364XZS5_9BACT|nr:YdcF family protein [Pseudochryseolinea flava]RAV99510.1 YdcF family protein [Pseudochryseolinea flava]
MRYLKYTLIVLVTWFAIHTLCILIDGFTDDNVRADVGVIFGNTVHPDGTLSPRLQARLDRGLKLYQDSLVNILMVSGGLGKEGHFEGTKMFEYLVSKGVPEENIIIDNEGNNSNATVHNVQKLIVDVKSVTVVSQYHHISRAKLAFRKNGFTRVYGAHADFFELRDFYSIAREFVGYYRYLLQ